MSIGDGLLAPDVKSVGAIWGPKEENMQKDSEESTPEAVERRAAVDHPTHDEIELRA